MVSEICVPLKVTRQRYWCIDFVFIFLYALFLLCVLLCFLSAFFFFFVNKNNASLLCSVTKMAGLLYCISVSFRLLCCTGFTLPSCHFLCLRDCFFFGFTVPATTIAACVFSSVLVVMEQLCMVCARYAD